MNKPLILFRKSLTTEKEISAAHNAGFEISFSRINQNNKIVFARYCALPFFQELEQDLKLQNSQLINDYDSHCYIANFDYYHDLNTQKETLTFESHFDLQTLPEWENGYIVKGRTNSKKMQFDRKMYAKTKNEAIQIYLDLSNDPLINEQGIIFRKFENLTIFETGINGLPFANEWRCFFYKNKLLSYGYYWTIAQNIPSKNTLPKEALLLAQKAANIISQKVNFFTIDIAQKCDENWIVVEVNDGMQSGLCDNDPNELYKNLQVAINTK